MGHGVGRGWGGEVIMYDIICIRHSAQLGRGNYLESDDEAKKLGNTMSQCCHSVVLEACCAKSDYHYYYHYIHTQVADWTLSVVAIEKNLKKKKKITTVIIIIIVVGSPRLVKSNINDGGQWQWTVRTTL